jgi:hypothetical protein
MARRSLDGQLNMFDFWNHLPPSENGEEVQMVSLMPDAEAEPEEPEESADEPETDAEEAADVAKSEETEEAADVAESEETEETVDVPEEDAITNSRDLQETDDTEEIAADNPVMHKEIRNADGSIRSEISFYNYNRICLKRQNEQPVWKIFDNSKEAVDFYIEEMLKL